MNANGASDQSRLIDALRSRGHFKAVVHPLMFDSARIEYSALLPTLRRCVVRLRGWDVPHIDDQNPIVQGEDSISQGTQWKHHVEYWRFHQSALFVHLHGMAEDWREPWGIPQPHEPFDWQPAARRLGVGGTVYMYAEAFEFAARLAAADVSGSDPIIIKIEAAGLAGRQLFVDSKTRTEFHRPRVATVDRFGYERRFSRSELLADALELSLMPARELFGRFGWDPSMELLRELQRELLRDTVA